jgi:hypothetical protein
LMSHGDRPIAANRCESMLGGSHRERLFGVLTGRAGNDFTTFER